MSNFASMRAIEYIKRNYSSISHVEEIIRVINELKPLRLNKNATDLYYNQILCMDIRMQLYLLQKELYQSGNAMQSVEPSQDEPSSFQGQIPMEYAAEFRETLFNVIKEDASFGYLFFLLGNEQNAKHQSRPIDCVPNHEKIAAAVSANRDGYPQSDLNLYLDDDFNYEHYNELVGKKIYTESEILNFFNELYRIYDELRCCKDKISSVRQYCQTLSFSSDKDKFFIVSTIISLIEQFGTDDVSLIKCKGELKKLISGLEQQFKERKKEEEDSASTATKGSNKVKTAVLLELLNKIGKGKSQNDLSKICRLVAYLTGGSEAKIYNDAQGGIQLTNYHNAEIQQVNGILKDLDLEIKLKKDVEY